MSEEDRASIRAILIDLSALNFSQATRIKLHATTRRRHLPHDFNEHAVNQIPRTGPLVFGGKFLEAVDSDLDMNKRAKEVADRLRPRQSGPYIVFAAGAPPFWAVEGFVPVQGDAPDLRSLSAGEVFGRRSPVRTPPLNPPNDYMVDVPVNPAPVSGRLSLFVAQWQTIT